MDKMDCTIHGYLVNGKLGLKSGTGTDYNAFMSQIGATGQPVIGRCQAQLSEVKFLFFSLFFLKNANWVLLGMLF